MMLYFSSRRLRFALLPLLACLLIVLGGPLSNSTANAATLPSATATQNMPYHLVKRGVVDQKTLTTRLQAQMSAAHKAASSEECAMQPKILATPNNMPQADLALTETDDGPANSMVGDGLKVMHWQATVTNIGGAATTHSTSLVLLHFGDSAKNLFSTFTIPVLQPGQTKSFTGSLNYAQGGEVVAWFDLLTSCYYQESNYNNNGASRDFIVQTKGTDLSAYGYSYHGNPNHAGDGITSGESFSLYIEIANYSDAFAGETITAAITLPFGGKATLHVPTPDLPQFNQVFSYELVDTMNQPVMFTAPSVTHAKFYKGTFTLNPTHILKETSYSNNTRKGYFEVVPAGVNLTLYATVNYPTCFPLVGETDGSIAITVENNGSQSSNATQGRLMIDGKTQQTFTIPSISGGAEVNIPLTLPAMTKAGKHTFTVTVDSTNTIPEYNEKDNTDSTTKTFYVTAPK